MYTKKDLQKVREVLENASNVAILSHQNPDYDALGSATALYQVLTGLGKKVRMFVPNAFPDSFSFIPSIEKVEILEGNKLPQIEALDLVIFVDGGELHRFVNEGEFEIPENITTVKIDHHLVDYEISDLSLQNAEASSAAEISCDLIKFAEWKITKGVAKSLMVGIFGDTGWLKYVATTPRVLRITADLLEISDCLPELEYHFSHGSKVEYIPMWQLLMENLRVDNDRSLVFTFMDYKQIRSLGIDDSDVSSAYHEFMVGIMRGFPDVDTSLILLERGKDVWHGSMRSETGIVEVNRVCAEFEAGGGHSRAAGFSTKKGYEEVMKIVREGLEKYRVK